MRLLRLRTYCYPEVVAASAMAEDIDNGFEKSNIVSINYAPTPSRGISKAVRKAYKNKKYEEFKNGHVIVHRFPMIKEGKSIIQKAFRYFLCTIIEYFKGISEKDIDIVFGYSTPLQGILCGKVAQKLSSKQGKKVPFVYVLQDVFPDSLIATGIIKKNSILWKIGRKMEDYTYRSADKIIVISEEFKQNIMQKGIIESKITVIPNWADSHGVYLVNREDNVLFDEYNLDRSKFYICYSGTVGHAQNINLIIDIAKKIKRDLPKVCFVIVGDGAEKANIEKRIREEDIDNVILIPFQPYEKLAYVFGLGDVGLVICKPGVGGVGVPSKTWNIMAAEKPILASFDKDSELSSLIEKIGCGMVADAGSKEELIKAVQYLAGDKNLQEKGKRGKEYVSNHLNKNECVKKYIETLLSTLKE